MEWLNYHHLYYFWVVAKSQSIKQATLELNLSQPTISTQIKTLENALGEQLFIRQGKSLILSEQGKTVFRFADEIFSIGKEMIQTLKGIRVDRPIKFYVGISDIVPKLIAHHLLQPALDQFENLELHCHEGPTDELFLDLANHNLDLVITDTKPSNYYQTKLFSQTLGSSGVSFFGTKELLKKHPQKFPQCLNGAPLLMPSNQSYLRKGVELWLQEENIQPSRISEFDDTALMKVFGQFGNGFFFSPTVLEKDIESLYDVSRIARVSHLKERFYAVSADRKIIHPAIVTIASQSKKRLFKRQ